MIQLKRGLYKMTDRFGMRYLIVFLGLFLFVGCGESQYERCLKVEKAKVVENWDDIYQIAKRLVLNSSFPLDFRGVLDQEITTQEAIQKLRDGLQVLASLPLVEIQKKYSEMELRGIENPEEASGYNKVFEAWDSYYDLSRTLAQEDVEMLDQVLDQTIDSHQSNSDSGYQSYYFGAPDEVILEVQYEALDAIEKSNQEAKEKLDLVRNKIASDICNSRGLY
jgi:hypothetical protein